MIDLFLGLSSRLVRDQPNELQSMGELNRCRFGNSTIVFGFINPPRQPPASLVNTEHMWSMMCIDVNHANVDAFYFTRILAEIDVKDNFYSLLLKLRLCCRLKEIPVISTAPAHAGVCLHLTIATE